jgi:hypothetical protein
MYSGTLYLGTIGIFNNATFTIPPVRGYKLYSVCADISDVENNVDYLALRVYFFFRDKFNRCLETVDFRAPDKNGFVWLIGEQHLITRKECSDNQKKLKLEWQTWSFHFRHPY